MVWLFMWISFPHSFRRVLISFLHRAQMLFIFIRAVLVDLKLCHPPSACSSLPSSPCKIFQSSSVLILSLNFASSAFHQHDPDICTGVISRKTVPKPKPQGTPQTNLSSKIIVLSAKEFTLSNPFFFFLLVEIGLP